jgi:hypothetical protein
MKAIIKPLFDKLHNKSQFIEALAEKVDRSPATLENHWFSRYWRVPSDLRPFVIKELAKAIKLQAPKEAVAA